MYSHWLAKAHRKFNPEFDLTGQIDGAFSWSLNRDFSKTFDDLEVVTTVICVVKKKDQRLCDAIHSAGSRKF